MRLRSGPERVCRIVRPRLAEIATDLGISETQRGAWEVFVETFRTVADLLETIDDEVAGQFAERPPSLCDALELELISLSAHLEAVRMLKANTKALYSMLTQRQRVRADRLLPTLCAAFAWLSRPAGERVVSSAGPTRASDGKQTFQRKDVLGLGFASISGNCAAKGRI